MSQQTISIFGDCDYIDDRLNIGPLISLRPNFWRKIQSMRIPNGYKIFLHELYCDITRLSKTHDHFDHELLQYVINLIEASVNEVPDLLSVLQGLVDLMPLYNFKIFIRHLIQLVFSLKYCQLSENAEIAYDFMKLHLPTKRDYSLKFSYHSIIDARRSPHQSEFDSMGFSLLVTLAKMNFEEQCRVEQEFVNYVDPLLTVEMISLVFNIVKPQSKSTDSFVEMITKRLINDASFNPRSMLNAQNCNWITSRNLEDYCKKELHAINQWPSKQHPIEFNRALMRQFADCDTLILIVARQELDIGLFHKAQDLLTKYWLMVKSCHCQNGMYTWIRNEENPTNEDFEWTVTLPEKMLHLLLAEKNILEDNIAKAMQLISWIRSRAFEGKDSILFYLSLPVEIQALSKLFLYNRAGNDFVTPNDMMARKTLLNSIGNLDTALKIKIQSEKFNFSWQDYIIKQMAVLQAQLLVKMRQLLNFEEKSSDDLSALAEPPAMIENSQASIANPIWSPQNLPMVTGTLTTQIAHYFAAKSSVELARGYFDRCSTFALIAIQYAANRRDPDDVMRDNNVDLMCSSAPVVSALLNRALVELAQGMAINDKNLKLARNLAHQSDNTKAMVDVTNLIIDIYTLWRNGQMNGLLAYCDKMASFDRFRIEADIWKAQTLLLMNRIDEAQRIIDNLIAINTIDVHLQLRTLLIRMTLEATSNGNAALTSSSLTRKIDQMSTDADCPSIKALALSRLACSQINAEQYEEALKSITDTLPYNRHLAIDDQFIVRLQMVVTRIALIGDTKTLVHSEFSRLRDNRKVEIVNQPFNTVSASLAQLQSIKNEDDEAKDCELMETEQSNSFSLSTDYKERGNKRIFARKSLGAFEKLIDEWHRLLIEDPTALISFLINATKSCKQLFRLLKNIQRFIDDMQASPCRWLTRDALNIKKLILERCRQFNNVIDKLKPEMVDLNTGKNEELISVELNCLQTKLEEYHDLIDFQMHPLIANYQLFA